MTTSNEDIQHALNKHCSTFTALTSVVYENIEYSPTIGIPYLRTWLLPGETFPLTLGPEGVMDYGGVFQIDCCYPKGRGWKLAKDMAGKVCTHFNRGTLITYNNILVRIRRAWPGPAIIEEELYRVPVSVLYECFDNS